MNANYLLNNLISTYKEHQGIYYSFIKAHDNLYKQNLYVQVTNYLKTLSIYFRMYTVFKASKGIARPWWHGFIFGESRHEAV